MLKKLTRHGNSAALVIDRPILEILNADIGTAFEVSTDGCSLILTPVKHGTRPETRASIERIGKRYAKTFEELAK